MSLTPTRVVDIFTASIPLFACPLQDRCSLEVFESIASEWIDAPPQFIDCLIYGQTEVEQHNYFMSLATFLYTAGSFTSNDTNTSSTPCLVTVVFNSSDIFRDACASSLARSAFSEYVRLLFVDVSFVSIYRQYTAVALYRAIVL